MFYLPFFEQPKNENEQLFNLQVAFAEIVDTDEKLDKIVADYDFINDDEAENRKYDDLIFEYKGFERK